MLIFTRYLYIKDEVEYSLLNSILKRDLDKCFFWLKELYFSGFEDVQFLVLFYYKYFFEMHPQYLDEILSSNIIEIVSRLLQLDSKSPEIYLFKEYPELSDENQFELFEKAMTNKDLDFIQYYLMQYCDEMCLPHVLNMICKFFGKKRMVVEDKRRMYFLFIKSYLNSKEERIEKEVIEIGEWCETEERAWKRLKENCIYAVDPDIRAFSKVLERDAFSKKELDVLYRTKWVYYVSFGSLWKKRIELYGGKINHKAKRVEELDEEFFEEFDLEPDEQSLETREKCIGEII